MRSLLVVDDNLVCLKQIGSQLSGKYEISLAKSGEVALQICAREPPDLILLDVEMPVMNGYETISRLKSDPVLRQIPVVFLTGDYDSETEVKCLEAGAVDYILKPANTEILLHRIRMHLEYSDYQRHLENVVKELGDNIGVSFAELMEYRDRNLAGHVMRTSTYAELLANELLRTGVFKGELNDEDPALLKRTVAFHDIGKIGISDLILLKKGPLTEEEYTEARRHTTIGGKMLRQIYSRTPNEGHLKVAAIVAESHHEEYDGKGYPAGLKGNDIPLYSRILSVANVYDSCVTDKVYRRRLPHETVCRIILDGRGTKFDPRVADVFMKLQGRFASLYANFCLSANNYDNGPLL
jgi:putative two-component system response regulator